jgi:oligopeptide transport system substrate-binding protein
MPVNKSFYDKQPVENNIGKYGSDAETVLGNGPFRISEWKHDSRIVLERNDKYWNKENVAMKKVVFKIIRDASAAFTEFKAGEIDMTDITAEQREQCVREGITVNSYDRGATVYLDFNNKDTVLSNVNIRRPFDVA